MRWAGAWSTLVGIVLLGCPAADVPSGGSLDGGASEGDPSEGDPTSSVSATGMLPPATSTGSEPSTGVPGDSTAGASSGEPTGTTSREDIGEPDDGTMCDSPCGNGVICGTEQCDCGSEPCTPEGLGFAECAGLVDPIRPDRVHTGGTLDCSPASCQFVFAGCTWCGDAVVNGNETCDPEDPAPPTCASLGLGDATEPLPCDERCQLDSSSCV